MHLAVFLIVQVTSYVLTLQWETVEVDQQGNFTYGILSLNETLHTALTDCLCSPAQKSCNVTYSPSDHTVSDVDLVTDNMTSFSNTFHRTCSYVHGSVVWCSPRDPPASYCHSLSINESFRITNYTCDSGCLSILWTSRDFHSNTSSPSNITMHSCNPGCVAPLTVMTTTTVTSNTSFSPAIATVSNPSGDHKTGLIVGIVLGICAACAFVIIAIVYQIKRKAQSTPKATVESSQTPGENLQASENRQQMYNSLYPETAASANVAYTCFNVTGEGPEQGTIRHYDTAYSDSDNVDTNYSNPDEYECVESINNTDNLGYLVLDNIFPQTAKTLDTKPKISTSTVKNDSPLIQNLGDQHLEVEYENLQSNLYIDMSVHQPTPENLKRRTEDIASISSSSSNNSIYVNDNL